jgi:hypothetical protein
MYNFVCLYYMRMYFQSNWLLHDWKKFSYKKIYARMTHDWLLKLLVVLLNMLNPFAPECSSSHCIVHRQVLAMKMISNALQEMLN